MNRPKKLDIASGDLVGPSLPNGKREAGWTGIDLMPGSDIVWDLNEFPWPIESGSVSKVRINHYCEHIPHWRPGWQKDGWFLFWEEVYRITRKGATVDITHPYLKSDRAFWDPTHTRFIPAEVWYYLDPSWREANSLGHYTDVDFEIVTVAFAGMADDMVGRNDDYVRFHQMHSWNVHPDLVVKLKRR